MINSLFHGTSHRATWTRQPLSLYCCPDTTMCLVSPQVRELAAAEGVVLGGENALPCFSPNGVDATALERIVYNTQVAFMLLIIECTRV
jgi:hypothetical protein